MDVSDPTDPRNVSLYVNETEGYGFQATGVVVPGRYAYVVDNAQGLVILDVKDPKAPVLVGLHDPDSWAGSYGIAYFDAYIYLASSYNGLFIIDAKKPSQPKLVAHFDTSGDSRDVVAKRGHAYVADGDNGLVVIKVPIRPDEGPGFWETWLWTIILIVVLIIVILLLVAGVLEYKRYRRERAPQLLTLKEMGIQFDKRKLKKRRERQLRAPKRATTPQARKAHQTREAEAHEDGPGPEEESGQEGEDKGKAKKDEGKAKEAEGPLNENGSSSEEGSKSSD